MLMQFSFWQRGAAEDICQVSRIVKGGDIGRLNFDLAFAARRHAEEAALHYFGEKTLHSHHPAKLSN